MPQPFWDPTGASADFTGDAKAHTKPPRSAGDDSRPGAQDLVESPAGTRIGATPGNSRFMVQGGTAPCEPHHHSRRAARPPLDSEEQCRPAASESRATLGRSTPAGRRSASWIETPTYATMSVGATHQVHPDANRRVRNQSAGHADSKAGDNQGHRTAKDGKVYVTLGRAESHADANLARAFRLRCSPVLPQK